MSEGNNFKELGRLLSCGTSRRRSQLGSAVGGWRAEGEEIFAAGAKIFWFRQTIICWATILYTEWRA